LIEQAGFKGKRFGDAGIQKTSIGFSELWKCNSKKILNVSKNIQETILKHLASTLKLK
jgi:UDP-N-acetylenolpyruvoylglucosamine reductase